MNFFDFDKWPGDPFFDLKNGSPGHLLKVNPKWKIPGWAALITIPQPFADIILLHVRRLQLSMFMRALGSISGPPIWEHWIGGKHRQANSCRTQRQPGSSLINWCKRLAKLRLLWGNLQAFYLNTQVSLWCPFRATQGNYQKAPCCQWCRLCPLNFEVSLNLKHLYNQDVSYAKALVSFMS